MPLVPFSQSPIINGMYTSIFFAIIILIPSFQVLPLSLCRIASRKDATVLLPHAVVDNQGQTLIFLLSVLSACRSNSIPHQALGTASAISRLSVFCLKLSIASCADDEVRLRAF